MYNKSMGVTAGIGLASGLFGMATDYMSNRGQSQLAQQNTLIQEENLRRMQQQDAYNRSIKGKQINAELGRQEVASSTSGLGGVTADDISFQNAREAEDDLLNLDMNNEYKQANQRYNISLARQQATSSKRSMWTGLLGGLAKTGANMYSSGGWK